MPVDTTKPALTSKSRRPSKKDLDEDRFDSAHTREIELKRSRGEISCAECRRLKIRCDKSIPCKSCQRRGCAALCPNGSLATGQGTRFVLAATEHLHKRITNMKERIRKLEDALAILHAQSSNDPHPLLRDELLSANIEHDEDDMTDAESTPARPPDIIDAFGTLSVSEHGVSRFFGPTGGAEYLLYDDHGSNASCEDYPASDRDSMTPPIHGELTRFSVSFPFTPIGAPGDVRRLIETHLPSWERATHLAKSYAVNAAWLFQSIAKEQVEEMLPAIYKKPRPEVSEEDRPYQDYSGPHDLALLLLIFAIGALMDLSQEPYNAEAEHYHILARASLCLQPVLEKPSLVAIQALYLLGVYTAMCGNDHRSGETTMESSWSLLTLSAQLAQSIGLHRDSARWGLPDYVVERRRILFWDLFVSDVWQSLTTGRPPSFSREYIDCKFPASPAREGEEEEDDDRPYESLASRFALECVAEVASRALAAEPPSYATIMALDRKVREFAVPPEVVAVVEEIKQPEDEEPVPISVSFGRMVMSHFREIVLLWIHRSFFAQAIIDCPSNPLRSTYAPSFLASYRASVTILKTIKNQFDTYPAACSRIWLIWTYAFSATVVFGTVVTRGPRSPLAGSAAQQLDVGCELFEKAAIHSRRAAKALPILNRLRDKAHAALAAAKHDPRSDGTLWAIKVDDVDDELDIFAGRTRLVSSKRPSPSPISSAGDAYSVQGYTSASASTPSPPSAAMYNSRPQPAIYPPTLPPIPPLRVPDTPVPGPSNAKWLQGQGVPVNSQGYPPDAYQPPAPQRHSSYYATPPAFSQGPPIHSQQHSLPYNWQPDAPPPVSRLHSSYAPMQQQQQQQQQQRQQQHQQQQQQQQQQHQAPYPPAHFHSPADGYAHSPHPPAQPQGRALHGTPSPTAYLPPPPELVNLGLAARDSRLEDRWTSFMHESGFLEGMNGSSPHPPPPPY